MKEKILLILSKVLETCLKYFDDINNEKWLIITLSIKEHRPNDYQKFIKQLMTDGYKVKSIYIYINNKDDELSQIRNLVKKEPYQKEKKYYGVDLMKEFQKYNIQNEKNIEYGDECYEYYKKNKVINCEKNLGYSCITINKKNKIQKIISQAFLLKKDLYNNNKYGVLQVVNIDLIKLDIYKIVKYLIITTKYPISSLICTSKEKMKCGLNEQLIIYLHIPINIFQYVKYIFNKFDIKTLYMMEEIQFEKLLSLKHPLCNDYVYSYQMLIKKIKIYTFLNVISKWNEEKIFSWLNKNEKYVIKEINYLLLNNKNNINILGPLRQILSKYRHYICKKPLNINTKTLINCLEYFF